MYEVHEVLVECSRLLPYAVVSIGRGGGHEVRTLLLPLTVRSRWAYLTACLMHDPLLVACRTDPARYTSGIAVPIGRIRRYLL